MANTVTATCIDSKGIERQYKRSWLVKQEALGKCRLGSDGVFRFRCHAQANGGANHREPQGQGARISFRVRLRSTDPTPETNGDFLSYPFASRTSGRSLRALYPTLARPGAGLG